MTTFHLTDRARGTLLVAVVTAAWLTLVANIAFHRPPWGDERHYLETVRTFGRDLSAETLRTYPGELAPPLAFALYAGWGRLVGFEAPRLRLLSLVIAFATVLAVHGLACRVLRDGRDAVLAALFFLVHPYTVGLSVFVFNDMTAILFAVVLAIGVAVARPTVVIVASAAGLMTRQYFAFLTAAAALYYLIRWTRQRRSSDLAALAGLAGSCLPLVAMFLLWGGLGPASATRAHYLSAGLSFHPTALTLYVTQLFTFLWPLLLLHPSAWARHTRGWWATVAGLSFAYWLAPIRPAPAQIVAGIDTIGLLHRAIRATVGRMGAAAEDVFFWIAFGLGVAVLLSLAGDIVSRRKDAWPDARAFLGFAVLSFLVVMPFSYLHWEKYFMPLLPLAAVLLLAMREDGRLKRDVRARLGLTPASTSGRATSGGPRAAGSGARSPFARR